MLHLVAKPDKRAGSASKAVGIERCGVQVLWLSLLGVIDMNKFHPLQEWLNTLPEPITFHEKLICWWSNLIDDISILKWKLKHK